MIRGPLHPLVLPCALALNASLCVLFWAEKADAQRGKDKGSLEATRLVTGDPTRINAEVAGTPPTAVLKVVPVAAKVGSYPGGTTIVGNELTAFTGGFRAWFEFKLSDWDPNGDNVPPLLIWQFRIDNNGF